MRRSIAAVALIRRERDGQMLWLAQWNPKWGWFFLISGHKRPDESFRECMVREVAEELRLHDGQDFAVAQEPLVHLEFEAWSKSAAAETHYIMELFEVSLSSEAALATVNGDTRNQWLTEAEIRSGRTGDGRPVSSTMATLLAKEGGLPKPG